MVETAPVERLFRHPRHPYTRGLLEAIPRLAGSGDKLSTIKGSVPAPGAMPEGCRFADRCNRMLDRCRTDPPLLVDDDGHAVACWNPA